MDKFRIVGGRRIEGSLRVSGAKNSALPCMAAALLAGDRVVLQNVPYVRDIITMRRLLEDVGCTVLVPVLRTMEIDASSVDRQEAPYDLVKTMRASVLALGPLLARFGRAQVSLPGGCAIGVRPIDLHLQAFEKMGATIAIEDGNIVAKAARLTGAHIQFDQVTVTGTENAMMAATLARGVTTLSNAAREPEIADLAVLLAKMGAKIEGAGSSTITIRGVDQLSGAEHSILPDRIEAGTFLLAGALCGDSIEVQQCRPENLATVVDKLMECGVECETTGDDSIRVRRPAKLTPADMTTQPYPGFPTDLQAQYTTLMTQAVGSAIIHETIFENRFMHVGELQRLGADITTHGRQAVVRGGKPLHGARVIASDLRASASLVLAGLVASGETIVDRVYHIDRGYEKIEEKLRGVGAVIERFRD